MTLMRRPSPLGELVSLRHAMDRLFDDSVVRPRSWGIGGDTPTPLPLDISSTAEALIVNAALPGIRPDDVEITVEDGTLTIRAEARQEREVAEGEVLVSEIRLGSVSRAIALPSGLEPDRATASFEHGLLHLSIPRAEAVKPRQIRINPTIEGQSTNGSDGPGGASAPTDDLQPGA